MLYKYFLKNEALTVERYFALGFLLLVLVLWLYVDIKTVLNKGIYITQQHIVTFSGKTIPIENVYYK